MTAAGERHEALVDDPIVFPRRDQTWRAGEIFVAIFLVLAVAGVVEREWTWVPVMVGIALAFGVFAAVLVRWPDHDRLVVDDDGLSVLDRAGDVEAFTPWQSITGVLFASGKRFPTFDRYPRRLPTVSWLDDAPYERWNPSGIVASVDPVVIGCRAAEDLERTLRAACDAHDVPYDAEWSWGWWLRRRTVNRRNRSN